jgi:hypothetical protein
MPFCPRCGREEFSDRCAECQTPIPRLDPIPAASAERHGEDGPSSATVGPATHEMQMSSTASSQVPRFVYSAIIIIALAALSYVGWSNARAQNAATDAQRRTEERVRAETRRKAWVAHEQRLAWQKAHPAEYAAQRARARAAAERAARAASAARERQRAADAARAERAKREADPCGSGAEALRTESQQLSYQRQYDIAVSGLHYSELCENELIHTVLKGKLLGWKAVSEHQLSSGHSADDINQAITLLARCQMLPGAYGESIGANCETEEETLIRIKMNWDMNE